MLDFRCETLFIDCQTIMKDGTKNRFSIDPFCGRGGKYTGVSSCPLLFRCFEIDLKLDFL